MKCTSAQANKLLKQLNEEYATLLDKESRTSTFNATIGEDVESARPKYDYVAYQKQIEALEKKIRIVKHAINIFNTTTVISDFGMTIDEMLVYIPQLTKTKTKLQEMRSRAPKERVKDNYHFSSTIIDYTYTNYDLDQVEKDYHVVCDKLTKAQLALDTYNSKEEIMIEL